MTYAPPQLTLDDYNAAFADRHLLHGVVEKWAREKPQDVALIDARSNQRISWSQFDLITRALSGFLLERGLRRGNFFASLLPLTCEHVLLEYACFRIGVIFVPLDLRLGAAELMRSLKLVEPKAFAFVKAPGLPDPSAFCAEFTELFSPKLLVQFARPEDCVDSAVAMSELLHYANTNAAVTMMEKMASPDGTSPREMLFQAATAAVTPERGALVIFTTGSTGSPKAALLSHRNITCQNMALAKSLLHGSTGDLVTLVNLPPSHVGCQTELLMSTLFDGGTSVLLDVFDPARSLRAIADYKVTALGQIPAMFNFEWRLKEYDSYDLSSLDFAAYGGQSVPPAFLHKMATMAPNVGSGLGLTETAGFCTYIRRPAAQVEECASSLGHAVPVYPLTIRQEMQPDGRAGEELAAGELGHVCFRGPQTFLGYVNDEAATRATLSSDGYLYTGDMGRLDATGALLLAGRTRHIIKPSGYMVFPGDVENHFSLLEGVASVAVVGVPHPVTSEAVIAFVEPQPGAELTTAQLHRHARELAAYMRPYHFILVEPGQMPLNRVAKADYLALRDRAVKEMEKLEGK